ncbi:MAG: 4-hydroxybenzoate octaprenyltransferase [Nitrospira sp. CR1.1]|jgi:4-hydroxybenzoate polyprenyltransferase|nr:4-hydroxybenzoate octaprenyltransferase [Nitrospira sp. CR1.1]
MVQRVISATDSTERRSPPWTWKAVADLIRLNNQAGTWLLLLPSLWSLVLANHGRPPMRLIGIFILGAFLMRSLGVVLNDLADRNFDKHVARTSNRPLASGRLVPRQALLVALTLALLAGGLVSTLNWLTILLSPIALSLAAVYPFCKRWIQMPQAVLGIAFGWGAIMAWAASRGTIASPAWWLFAATVCWAVAYDTIYALQDREDDRRIGVKSSALLFGTAVPAAVGLFLLGMLVCLVIVGQLSGLGMGYYVALTWLAGGFLWQARRLRVPVTPPQAFTLFQQHILAGLVILITLWISAPNEIP